MLKLKLPMMLKHSFHNRTEERVQLKGITPLEAMQKIRVVVLSSTDMKRAGRIVQSLLRVSINNKKVMTINIAASDSRPKGDSMQIALFSEDDTELMEMHSETAWSLQFYMTLNQVEKFSEPSGEDHVMNGFPMKLNLPADDGSQGYIVHADHIDGDVFKMDGGREVTSVVPNVPGTARVLDIIMGTKQYPVFPARSSVAMKAAKDTFTCIYHKDNPDAVDDPTELTTNDGSGKGTLVASKLATLKDAMRLGITATESEKVETPFVMDDVDVFDPDCLGITAEPIVIGEGETKIPLPYMLKISQLIDMLRKDTTMIVETAIVANTSAIMIQPPCQDPEDFNKCLVGAMNFHRVKDPDNWNIAGIVPLTKQQLHLGYYRDKLTTDHPESIQLVTGEDYEQRFSRVMQNLSLNWHMVFLTRPPAGVSPTDQGMDIASNMGGPLLTLNPNLRQQAMACAKYDNGADILNMTAEQRALEENGISVSFPPDSELALQLRAPVVSVPFLSAVDFKSLELKKDGDTFFVRAVPTTPEPLEKIIIVDPDVKDAEDNLPIAFLLTIDELRQTGCFGFDKRTYKRNQPTMDSVCHTYKKDGNVYINVLPNVPFEYRSKQSADKNLQAFKNFLVKATGRTAQVIGKSYIKMPYVVGDSRVYEREFMAPNAWLGDAECTQKYATPMNGTPTLAEWLTPMMESISGKLCLFTLVVPESDELAVDGEPQSDVIAYFRHDEYIAHRISEAEKEAKAIIDNAKQNSSAPDPWGAAKAKVAKKDDNVAGDENYALPGDEPTFVGKPGDPSDWAKEMDEELELEKAAAEELAGGTDLLTDDDIDDLLSINPSEIMGNRKPVERVEETQEPISLNDVDDIVAEMSDVLDVSVDQTQQNPEPAVDSSMLALNSTPPGAGQFMDLGTSVSSDTHSIISEEEANDLLANATEEVSNTPADYYAVVLCKYGIHSRDLADHCQPLTDKEYARLTLKVHKGEIDGEKLSLELELATLKQEKENAQYDMDTNPLTSGLQHIVDQHERMRGYPTVTLDNHTHITCKNDDVTFIRMSEGDLFPEAVAIAVSPGVEITYSNGFLTLAPPKS